MQEGFRGRDRFWGVAHIDNLVERIADPALRAQIASELSKLVERKSFGLVFQRHRPEDVETPPACDRAEVIASASAEISTSRTTWFAGQAAERPRFSRSTPPAGSFCLTL